MFFWNLNYIWIIIDNFRKYNKKGKFDRFKKQIVNNIYGIMINYIRIFY